MSSSTRIEVEIRKRLDEEPTLSDEEIAERVMKIMGISCKNYIKLIIKEVKDDGEKRPS